METKAALLRSIPKMDVLLAEEEVRAMMREGFEAVVLKNLRAAVEEIRVEILNGSEEAPSVERIIALCKEKLAESNRMHQRTVVNATGVLLHTNLGRSLLAPAAAEAVHRAAINYTTLEFDCKTGGRGDRYSHVEGIIGELFGVESAIVVNNNAAAVLLLLSALAKDKEVIVSRGELVEIGGSFRVPEVMEQSGCILHEVGTTNKTHPEDYENAINENTAALLKVHTSNYRVIGFTEDVDLAELSAIAKRNGLPLLYDLGSGALLPLGQFGLKHEPTVQESIAKGADVICISGDKLLGGPQAGIIAGKKEYIDRMKKHPLMRALRVDKLTLAALEATLRIYRDPVEAAAALPLYKMLSQSMQELRERAEKLKTLLCDLPSTIVTVMETEGQVGGGSAPGETIPSVAVVLDTTRMSIDKLHHRLLCAEEPIVARIGGDRLILDMRTIPDSALDQVAKTLYSVI